MFKAAQSCSCRAAVWWGNAALRWSTGGITTKEDEKRKVGKERVVERSCFYLTVLLSALILPTSCLGEHLKNKNHLHAFNTDSFTDEHKHFAVKVTDTWSCWGHVKDMRLYDGEGRHEEQSGSGRQAGRHYQQSTDDDDDDRDEWEQSNTGWVSSKFVIDPKKEVNSDFLSFISTVFITRSWIKCLEEKSHLTISNFKLQYEHKIKLGACLKHMQEMWRKEAL